MTTRQTLHRLAAEKRVILQTKLPEVLAGVSSLKVEFYRVLVEPLNIQLDLSRNVPSEISAAVNSEMIIATVLVYRVYILGVGGTVPVESM